MSAPLPKLSYVLLSHNRENYIRGAIESAFAQDYEGELEYIFSDDCSTDRTFDIIKECVAEYKGNRRVVVTQTPKNLHLAGNTNHAVQFVESDWIVRADDDDYSSVDRCSIVGRAIAENPGCSYVYTLLEHFTDDSEESIRKRMTAKSTDNPPVERLDILQGKHDFWGEFSKPGTLHQVWSTRHFKEYGDLPLDGYWVDDVISNLRCCTLGYGIKVPSITAFIRKGTSNMSRGGIQGATSYSEIIRLEQFNDRYFNTTLPALETTQNQIERYLSERDSHNGVGFIDFIKKEIDKRRLLSTYWRAGIRNRLRIKNQLGYSDAFSYLRCLPLPLFAALASALRWLKSIYRN